MEIFLIALVVVPLLAGVALRGAMNLFGGDIVKKVGLSLLERLLK